MASAGRASISNRSRADRTAAQRGQGLKRTAPPGTRAPKSSACRNLAARVDAYIAGGRPSSARRIESKEEARSQVARRLLALLRCARTTGQRRARHFHCHAPLRGTGNMHARKAHHMQAVLALARHLLGQLAIRHGLERLLCDKHDAGGEQPRLPAGQRPGDAQVAALSALCGASTPSGANAPGRAARRPWTLELSVTSDPLALRPDPQLPPPRALTFSASAASRGRRSSTDSRRRASRPKRRRNSSVPVAGLSASSTRAWPHARVRRSSLAEHEKKHAAIMRSTIRNSIGPPYPPRHFRGPTSVTAR